VILPTLLFALASSRGVGEVRRPVLLKRAEPQCPETKDDSSVRSVLEAVVNKWGRVGDIKVVFGPTNAYTAAASEALHKWEFRPGTLNDQPVDVLLKFQVQGCSVNMEEQIYTLGVWHVKQGHEAEFIAAWRELGAIFASLPQPPSDKGILIQSTADPTLFYSFGPWRSAEDVAAMRANPRAQAGIARIRELCTEATPGTFRVVAESP